MNTTEQTFSDRVFGFIEKEYGQNVVKNVRLDRHKSVVNRLISSSSQKNDSIEHTGNKIIAMLRMNP